MVKDFLSKIKETGALITEKESLAEHTTFRIGGPAEYFISAANADELQNILKVCKECEIPWRIIGKGSNLLVRDEGVLGAVISLDRMNQVIRKEDHMICEAGASLIGVSRKAAEWGLSGLEFASGIPGSVGGAIVMNAGAYGGEMSMVVQSVTLMSEDGSIVTKSKEEMEFGYRKSIVEAGKWTVLKTELKLSCGNREAITTEMKRLTAMRVEKQPLEYPSAGSTFKRPEGYFAGKLIMDAGLRGFRNGDAQVAEKHCGFVINRGHASAKEVLELIKEVQEKVKEQTGVELETEVKIW